jgi:hypothetical protein
VPQVVNAEPVTHTGRAAGWGESSEPPVGQPQHGPPAMVNTRSSVCLPPMARQDIGTYQEGGEKFSPSH